MGKRSSIVVVLFLLTSLQSARAATEIQISSPIFDSAPYRRATTVASSGAGYLAVWEASPNPKWDSILEPPVTIYLSAIGADGVPLQPFPTAVGKGEDASVAWNGHEYLVVWGIDVSTAGPLLTPSIVGVRVREDGALIDPLPVPLVYEVNPYSYLTTIAWNGSEYLLTWNRGVALLDRDLHAQPISLTTAGGVPLYAAASGADFMVLPAVFTAAGQTLMIQPVSATGETRTPALLNGPHAAITGVSGGYALIWDDRSDLRSARMSADGTLSNSAIFARGHIDLPSAASRDGRTVAAWQRKADATRSVVCTSSLDAFLEPRCSNEWQHDATISISSTTTFLTWADRSTDGDVMRAAVAPLSDTPLAGSAAGRRISDSFPPAAERRSDGSVGAVWAEYSKAANHSQVHLGGLTNQGTKLADRVVFASAADQTSPIVSAGAARSMLLWTEGALESPKIRMTIVDDATNAVIATLPLAAGIAPSAAFDGKEWLVALESTATTSAVQFAIVNSDGAVLSSGSMPVSTATPVHSEPSVAWSGKSFFLMWRESAAPGQPLADRIELSAISAGGAASAPLTLDSVDGALGLPSLASNGDRVLASWGRPGNVLRQALFDSSGKQLGKVIDFAWPTRVTRTRSRAMPEGFAALAGGRIALTSSAGVALDTIDVPQIGTGDFVVDPSDRFTFIYSRPLGNATSVIAAQSISLPRRRPQNR